jgi:GNAT superfamily N-acetyltransferase
VRKRRSILKVAGMVRTSQLPAGSRIAIRHVTGDDVAAVQPLLEQLGYDLAPNEVQRRLTSVMAAPEHAVLLGESDGRVAGLLHLYIRPALEKPPEVVVQALVVDAGCRKGGIGRAMMAAAEDWARARGFASIALRSHIKRHEAHAFYAALGYRRVATAHLLRKVLK